ncbi:hypothetical protein ABZ027_41860 [Streptomyces sp. NPDC006332]|uniref:oxidoreductase n=1 Tax=Streptomyces sp. NPDC006332 TaxID=3155456 RepID=UPI0033B5E68F
MAPSPIPTKLPGATTSRELRPAEIEAIIERFATAAAVCETAGFNGVQVQAAHGYLISQFLSPLSNRRDDGWGGDLERRMRFGLEVVRRIRGRVGPGVAVGVKLNSADFQRAGFTEDESQAVLATLAPRRRRPHRGVEPPSCTLPSEQPPTPAASTVGARAEPLGTGCATRRSISPSAPTAAHACCPHPAESNANSPIHDDGSCRLRRRRS